MFNCFFLREGPPNGLDSKESACNAKDLGLIPEVGKIPWRREWPPTPGLLPGESHGWRSLVGYSPWDRKRVQHDRVADTFPESGKTLKSKHKS